MAAQKAEFQAKVAELEGGGTALQTQLKEYEARMAEQQSSFERQMRQKEVMLFDPVLSCDAVLQRCLLLC